MLRLKHSFAFRGNNSYFVVSVSWNSDLIIALIQKGNFKCLLLHLANVMLLLGLFSRPFAVKPRVINFCHPSSFRSYGDILHRMKDLCRYMTNFDNEAHAKYKNQVVYSTMLVFFKNAFQYVNSIQPSLFQGWFKNFRVSQNTDFG